VKSKGNMPLYIGGMEWERLFFGHASIDFSKPAFQRWEDAIEEAAAIQSIFSWDPKNPRTEMSRKLYDGVRERLREKYQENLALYCAIGTALDWHHGIDGFFRVGRYVVAIDLTTNKGKKTKGPDIVMVLAQDVMGAGFDRLCQKIANQFNIWVTWEEDTYRPKR